MSTSTGRWAAYLKESREPPLLGITFDLERLDFSFSACRRNRRFANFETLSQQALQFACVFGAR